jgi:hypothetical protein
MVKVDIKEVFPSTREKIITLIVMSIIGILCLVTCLVTNQDDVVYLGYFISTKDVIEDLNNYYYCFISDEDSDSKMLIYTSDEIEDYNIVAIFDTANSIYIANRELFDNYLKIIGYTT